MDLALNQDWDLDVSGGGPRLASGDDALVQHIGIRLRFFKGEWFLDDRIGVPYFQKILVKNPDMVGVRGVLRKAIATTPGIRSVDAFTLDVDAATRIASVAFSATKDNGSRLDYSKEFILT